MAPQPTTPTTNITSTTPLSALAADFTKWAKGRTGFTSDELIDIYALLVKLSPQRTQALKDEINALPTSETQTPGQQQTPTTLQPQPGKITLTQYFQAHPELTQDEILWINKNLTEFISQHPEIIVTWEPPTQPEEQPGKAKPKTPTTPGKTPTPTKPAAPTTPQKPPAPAPTKPAVPKEAIITRTRFPKWWNDEGIAKISLTSPGSQFVITARADYQLYIGTIVLTVSDECTMHFNFGQYGTTGEMRFGGTDEPRGIVIAMGNSPAPCGTGSFMVTAASSSSVSIGGFVSYYLWKKETEKVV